MREIPDPDLDLPIAITIGDVAGIGSEIIIKAYQQSPLETRNCFVVGYVGALQRASRVINAGCSGWPIIQIDHPREMATLPPHCIPVLAPSSMPSAQALSQISFGKINALAGQMAADCAIWAARAALNGEVAALVTAPLHKEALAAAGVKFPGHTELLQHEAATHCDLSLAQMPVRMMLANEELRTVLVSIHLSLRQAIEAVTFDNVLQTLRITHQALTALLGHAPRMAVAGLNPHAGEGGLFGAEEQTILIPAIQAAQDEGLVVQGPFAPDTIFMRARVTPGKTREFDVVIAMYHDQGLIPVKYLGVEHGVNVTLGLHGHDAGGDRPLVRTSPDHGTAFDIAGTGRADASSLVAALRMARSLSGTTHKPKNGS